MSKTTLKIAALMLASTTFVSAADAGGIRLSFGGPLGAFTAHPNYSSGPGGNAPKKHCAKSYDKPSYAKPSYVGRKHHDEDEAPVRKAKRTAPKVEVAEEAPAPRKIKKQAPKVEVAEETPAPRKIRKPKVVVEKPEVEDKPVEIKTAKFEDKSVISDATPAIIVPGSPPARTEEVFGTQSTNAPVRTAALTPATQPLETVKLEEARIEEPAMPVESKTEGKTETKTEAKSNAKAESTAAKICRKFSAAIAGLVEIPCGN